MQRPCHKTVVKYWILDFHHAKQSNGYSIEDGRKCKWPMVNKHLTYHNRWRELYDEISTPPSPTSMTLSSSSFFVALAPHFFAGTLPLGKTFLKSSSTLVPSAAYVSRRAFRLSPLSGWQSNMVQTCLYCSGVISALLVMSCNEDSSL